MKAIRLLIFFTAIIISLQGTSRDNDYDEVPFQITFVPPLGTNGTNGANCINQVSLNIFAGYASGLRGVEFGGFLNINRDFMSGVQFGGFANYTGGEADGVQFAGFANVNSDETIGAQFAGFTNINNGPTDGFQASGFINTTRGPSNVIQAAGFGNFSNDILGAQISGFGSIATGEVNGLQISGFSNIATANVRGAQISGFINTAYNVNGAQVSGFLNVAKNVKGIQFGIINVADTVKSGIPIGFLSFVKDGFHEFEFGVSEGFNTYTSFKIGVKKFYNIFSVGMQFVSDRFRWGFGYGLGTHLMDKDDLKINLELMSYHINEGAHWTNAYNDLQQAKLTFSKPIADNVSLFAGPTLNLMISDYQKYGHARSGSDFAPYHVIDGWSKNTNLKYWLGFNAGIRIH